MLEKHRSYHTISAIKFNILGFGIWILIFENLISYFPSFEWIESYVTRFRAAWFLEEALLSLRYVDLPGVRRTTKKADLPRENRNDRLFCPRVRTRRQGCFPVLAFVQVSQCSPLSLRCQISRSIVENFAELFVQSRLEGRHRQYVEGLGLVPSFGADGELARCELAKVVAVNCHVGTFLVSHGEIYICLYRTSWFSLFQPDSSPLQHTCCIASLSNWEQV